MEVVVTAGAIGRAKLQSNQHQVFLPARCPSCCPTNSVLNSPLQLLFFLDERKGICAVKTLGVGMLVAMS